jgi:hypothetical protein
MDRYTLLMNYYPHVFYFQYLFIVCLFVVVNTAITASVMKLFSQKN